jgi:hypothetical protein
LLVSTGYPALHKLGPRVQCYPVEFPLHECLLALDPLGSARETPNLNSWQRTGLLAAGTCQNILWRTIWASSKNGHGMRSVAMDAEAVDEDPESLSFFEDQLSLRWRYVAGQYERLCLDSAPKDYAIVKNGGANRYLRMCQWRLSSRDSLAPLVRSLVGRAKVQRALGVRWAVYGNGPEAQDLVKSLRRMGFLCVARKRTELIHSLDENLRSAAAWKMNDSLFSFDP